MAKEEMQLTGIFEIKPVALYINIDGNYGATNPLHEVNHYFNPESKKVIYVYPYPSQDDIVKDSISPQKIFDKWSGDIGDNDPTNKRLKLTMDQDREITAHFKEVENDDGFFITSKQKDGIDWYYSLHDGYFYK